MVTLLHHTEVHTSSSSMEMNMPVDPKTGQPLPYAGDPGAPADAPPMPEGGPEGFDPLRDLKPAADEADQILAEEAIGAEGAEGGEDVSVIAEMLGIELAKAQELWEAAQAMPATQDYTPEELAGKLVEDLDLRMKLEKLAAGEADQSDMDDMVGSMEAELGVDPGAPPAEMMLGGMPGPGMPQ